METRQQQEKKIKLDFKDSKYATGRRKTSLLKFEKRYSKNLCKWKRFNDYFSKTRTKCKL